MCDVWGRFSGTEKTMCVCVCDVWGRFGRFVKRMCVCDVWGVIWWNCEEDVCVCVFVFVCVY